MSMISINTAVIEKRMTVSFIMRFGRHNGDHMEPGLVLGTCPIELETKDIKRNSHLKVVENTANIGNQVWSTDTNVTINQYPRG